jgi:hypothetical protein
MDEIKLAPQDDRPILMLDGPLVRQTVDVMMTLSSN